uniref:DUF2040 domain-containing protein n=1 Tax=Caenorhabditis tropicalis TaxID=1561998 RepID=A0A1I7TKD5_9PELO
MKFKSSSRSTIVPGRRMITNQVAYHQAGIKENTSYLAEKTIAESSSILNDTQDDEERDWRKQGLTEKQIYLRLEDRRLKRIRNAENRLKKEMYGAKDFDELLEKHEYSERESDEEDVTIVAEGHRNIEVFAIPSLPKHLVSDKSMFKSPAVGAKGSGKAGLSCSTPKSANDVSMRSLRSLDISHVVAIDQLDVNRVNVHSKNVLIPIVEHAENSSLQKTFTIQKIQESIERSSTIQKDPETCEISSIQKTIELEEKKTISLQVTQTRVYCLKKHQILIVIQKKLRKVHRFSLRLLSLLMLLCSSQTFRKSWKMLCKVAKKPEVRRKLEGMS